MISHAQFLIVQADISLFLPIHSSNLGAFSFTGIKGFVFDTFSLDLSDFSIFLGTDWSSVLFSLGFSSTKSAELKALS